MAVETVLCSPRLGRPAHSSVKYPIRIFSDSQSALQSVRSWRASACQAMVAAIIKKLGTARVTLHWISGHAGIEGNRWADELAKTATRKESNQPPQRRGILWYLMRLALKRANVTAEPPPLKWAETGKFTWKIDAAFHLGKGAEIYRQLNSTEAAILTQLRTGKTFLNEYLHKIKAIDTAACDCGSAESVAHFLAEHRRTDQALETKNRGSQGDNRVCKEHRAAVTQRTR
ncbi:hypothetical protein EJ04DRAFT_196649 [Polyplosphaeria fusca]|uniref:RNase H type-1 domain-containing protein n=1 Tax=Polyplosphaeria fusca TaxID=682080 RepID=A0A9P4R7H7_9PLEO|nr:hypothetical protein EJ04DRAFT_196649 [Polyplosphaeria fusca]